ncbi:MAG: HEAT repeat domain-containing protein [Candidatus Heimdallarchaeota archaeon]|nr:HEAT repeat domain-containing protein [Candidatus Heimdallarchaeota archaeon]
MAKKQTIEKLVKTMNNEKKDWDKRNEAAVNLGESGNADAIEPLVNALEELNIFFKMKVIDALVKLEETHEMVWTPLTMVLWDAGKSADWRSGAAMALGKLKNENAVDGLLRALSSQEDPSSNFLNQLAMQSVAAKAFSGKGDKKAMDQLINLRRDSVAPLEVKSWVARSLGDQGNPKAVDPLIQSLKTEHLLIKKAAASALGKIGDKKAIEPIAAFLNTDEESLREDVVLALGKLGDKRALKPLIEMLDPESWKVGELATILGNIGDKEAKKPLEKIQNKVDDEETKEKIKEALEKLG